MNYEYYCTKCDRYFEKERPMEHRNRRTNCARCGHRAQRCMIPRSTLVNTGQGSRIPGWCDSLPGPRVYVQSKHHFKELLKHHGNGNLYAANL